MNKIKILSFLKSWILPPELFRILVNFKKKEIYQLAAYLEKLLDFENGYYVELGANNGINFANTLALEKKKNWKGVLIEPALNNFLELLKNRSNENHFDCCACVPFDFKNETLTLFYGDQMSVGENSQNFHDDYKKKATDSLKISENTPDFEQQIKFAAVAKPITTVLDDAKAPPKIDFLSLDVEGAELEVLKGLDFSKYTFDWMAIESAKISEIQDYLSPFGYVLHDQVSHHDYIFKKTA